MSDIQKQIDDVSFSIKTLQNHDRQSMFDYSLISQLSKYKELLIEQLASREDKTCN